MYGCNRQSKSYKTIILCLVKHEGGEPCILELCKSYTIAPIYMHLMPAIFLAFRLYPFPFTIYRRPRPRPLLPNASRLPSIFLTSLSLILSSAPLMRPTPGLCTSPPLPLPPPPPPPLPPFFLPPPRVWAALLLSRMTPFSLASRLRLASRAPAAATMPLRMLMGMRSCASTEPLEPRACRRRSVALCRVRPAENVFGSAAADVPWTTDEEKTDAEAALLCEGVRRCDSERRRRSSRSCARSEGASSGRGLAGLAEEEEEDAEGEG